MKIKKFKLELGNQELNVQIRNLAEKANGEVLVQYGDTLVLATCVMANQEREGINFSRCKIYQKRRPSFR